MTNYYVLGGPHGYIAAAGTRIDLVYGVDEARHADAELHIADFAASEP